MYRSLLAAPAAHEGSTMCPRDEAQSIPHCSVTRGRVRQAYIAVRKRLLPLSRLRVCEWRTGAKHR